MVKIKTERPEWLVEYRKRTSIIDVIDLAFSEACDCEVCKKLRETAKYMGELFMPSPEKRRI